MWLLPAPVCVNILPRSTTQMSDLEVDNDFKRVHFKIVHRLCC
jgi:hypothetical protein